MGCRCPPLKLKMNGVDPDVGMRSCWGMHRTLKARPAWVRRVPFRLSLVVAFLASLSSRGAEPMQSGPLEAGHAFRYVCQDAGNGGYESFPDVCRLKDGRLMVVFYAGRDHISLPNPGQPFGGRIMSVVSSDEGATWSHPSVVADTPKDDRDPSITALPDGRLLCAFFSYMGPGPTDVLLTESKDGGRSWSAPRLLVSGYAVSSPIRVLSTGRLMLGVYWENAANTEAHGAIMRSDDRGRTWSGPLVLDNSGARLDAETDLIELRDGTLYAAQRGAAGTPLHVATSTDRGRSWSASRPLSFQGHCPYLHRMRDGTLVLAVREYDEGELKGATTVRISRDEARTWSAPVIVDPSHGCYPSLVNLKDGSALIVYYQDRKEKADLRARRFQVVDGQVHFRDW